MTSTPPDNTLSTCPLCHTGDHYALGAGGHWRCGRCGHVWTTTRLATVEAYATWVSERASRVAAYAA